MTGSGSDLRMRIRITNLVRFAHAHTHYKSGPISRPNPRKFDGEFKLNKGKVIGHADSFNLEEYLKANNLSEPVELSGYVDVLKLLLRSFQSGYSG